MRFRHRSPGCGDRVASTLTLVDGFDPAGNRAAAVAKDAVLDLLRSHPAPFDPSSHNPGHITASAAVVSSKKERLLLVYHRRLSRWLQPGGHVEPGDSDIIETARREVLEETGLDLGGAAAARLVGMSVHEIPATEGEPAHLHHDLTFGFAIDPQNAARQRGTELTVWCPVDRLDTYGVDEPLRLSLERALA
jgi:8-oxo-dGTP pyrophosphatase MutT (NUDIX family)